MAEINAVSSYRRENSEPNFDNIYSFSEKYDFEIILSCWQKILIIILNILTGGFGTMLTPFMNKKKKKLRLIVAGILLGLFQIIHFLHFFSLFKGIKYVEDIYDIISGDKILETLFSNNSNDGSETIPFFEDTELNLAEIISQK